MSQVDVETELDKCIVTSRRSLGGQHTNGPDYSVRMYHPDYGLEVMVDQYRQRAGNLALAINGMKTLLTYLNTEE